MSGSKKQKIAGWIISGLVAAMLMGPSAMGKFTEWEGKAAMFEKMGFSTELMFKIGILEVTIAVLYLIPQTAFIGAILLTGYLGGAIVTHLRVGEPFIFPGIFGVVLWVALGLRQPDVFKLAMGKSTVSEPPANS